MKMIVLVLASIFWCCQFGNAQSKSSSGSRHIIIVNTKNNFRKVKELNVGDRVRIKLTNFSKVKGSITAIDSAFFTVGNRDVSLNEIRKISTRKEWVQGVGGAVIFGGLTLLFSGVMEDGVNTIASTHFNLEEEPMSDYTWMGMIATGAGVAMVLPNYREIGKYRLMSISKGSRPKSWK
jgi:small nuclear ribonucleoprotein (snRNP)-like protein